MLEMKEQHGVNRWEMPHMPAQGLLWRNGLVESDLTERAEAHFSLNSRGKEGR
jgi:hypothetical protein